VSREALLVVALHALREHARAPALHVHQLDARLRAHAPREGERLPVARKGGRRRAAELARDRARLAVPAIETRDLPDAFVHVLVVAVAAVARGVVNETSIARGERGIRSVRALVSLRELHSRPALHVPQPQLDDADRRSVGDALAADDVLAVRRPRGRAHGDFLLLRERSRAAPVERAGPEVLDARAVARERDLGSVRAEARLYIVSRTARDPLRFAAFDGKQIQIAQQREDDALPVGVHVEVKPGAGIGVERDRARRPDRRVDAPRRLPGRVVRARRRR
jgi:hypothetical protein